MRRGHRESGNAIVLSLLATFLLTGIGAGLASVSLSFNRTGSSFNSNVLATYAAEAGLEDAITLIGTGGYPTPAGNAWLLDNAIAYDVDRKEFPDLDDVPILENIVFDDVGARRDVRIDVWVYELDDVAKGYRVVSRAVAGNVRAMPGATHAWEVVGDVAITLAQDLRARDTFARFATFVDQGTLAFGRTRVAGDVHSNSSIQFHYGGAQFLNKVTAVDGFDFKNGATTGNTSFNEQDDSVDKIELPSVTDVAQFSQFASGSYNVSGDAQIEFLGDEVKITHVNPSTQEVLGEGTYPLPADGVIYVHGDVTSIKGKLNGRVTVSTAGAINITGNLLYVDDQGDSAMRLEKDGAPVDPASLPEGTAWKEEDGFKYAENPDFDSDGDRPVLGLMAGKEISLDRDGPYNLEVHAALFSASENWRADLEVERGNLRFLGSTTTRTPGARAQGSMGYSLSGEYIYDKSLLDSPPPNWLPVNKLFLGPRWRL